MKKLRRTCAVAIVTVVLAVSAFAGQIDSPGVVAPPPPGTIDSPGIAGIIDSPGAPAPSETTSTSTTTTIILTILSLIR